MNKHLLFLHFLTLFTVWWDLCRVQRDGSHGRGQVPGIQDRTSFSATG